MEHFIYTKENGDTSERYVFALRKPSTMLFGIDLTEFTPEERSVYITSLELLEKDFQDAIADLGLRSQYRQFKEEGIEYVD